MRRIVKIGGSMLLRTDLTKAVNQWLAAHPADQTLIIVGGGKLIDAVRERDQLHPLNQQQVHWTCVDLLTTTAHFVAQMFGWPLITNPSQWKAAFETPTIQCLPTVIAPEVFYHQRSAPLQHDKSGDTRHKLPDDWRTTTDSIAGLLSAILDADELVLLKSCPIPATMSPTQLADVGIVDPVFPALAAQLAQVRIEQLL